MKTRAVFGLMLFLPLVFCPALFAFGSREAAEEKVPENAEWILCITAFDSSAMSPSWQTAGDTVARNLAGELQNLDYRQRSAEEIAYYLKYALTKSRAGAADALVRKREERDLLIFRGDPSWKYEKALKKAEEEIVKLEEELDKKYAFVPEIRERPLFKLNEGNRNGTFPKAPDPGKEESFCVEQKADAFLSGNLSEYYGRIYLEIRMYTRYSSSYTYEDSLLFSSENFNNALDEASKRLVLAVSGSSPASLLVHASPSEATVLIDNVPAERGEGESAARTRPAGSAEISVQAADYEPFSLPLELNAGELSELFINLTPLSRGAFGVETPGRTGSKIYLGSLFMGETPLTLDLPRTGSSYISVETPEGEVGSAIYRDNSIIGGNAQFVWNDGSRGAADFMTRAPDSPEEKKVENARNSFYKSYGVFWFILPAALLTSGIAGNYIDAYNSGSNPAISGKASLGSVARIGAWGAMGASLGYTFYQIYKYLSASGGDSTPIVKQSPEAEIENGE